eukprot:gene36309-47249_t
MDVEAFNEYATEQGWSDGMPLFVPTEAKVAKFVETVRGDNRPYAPVPPRQIVPTVQALAANAVMAGCKPEYFPVVTAALRGVLLALLLVLALVFGRDRPRLPVARVGVLLALVGRGVAQAIPRTPATDPGLVINWNPISETWRNLKLARENIVVF